MSEQESLSNWPTYNIGSKDHLHAVGVLVANWTTIEKVYSALFQFIFHGNFQPGMRAFELLGNSSRATLIREECFKVASPQFHKHIEYFLKCAAICKDNRNAVAHAHFVAPQNPAFAILDKGRSRDGNSIKFYRFTVSAIQEMADETHAVAMYGWHMLALMEVARAAPYNTSIPQHFVESARVPLLNRPTQPREWNLRSQAPEQEVQPSSEAAPD